MNIKLAITNFADIPSLRFIIRFRILSSFLSTLQAECQLTKVAVLCIFIVFIDSLAAVTSLILYFLRARTFILSFQLEYLIIVFIFMVECLISNLNLEYLWLYNHLSQKITLEFGLTRKLKIIIDAVRWACPLFKKFKKLELIIESRLKLRYHSYLSY